MRTLGWLLITLTFAAVGLGQDQSEGCPTVTVSNVPGLDEIAFAAKIERKQPLSNLKYAWQLSTGKIKSGQGTLQIVVVLPRTSPLNLTATLEVSGLPSRCLHTFEHMHSAVTEYAMTLEKYESLTWTKERARLDHIVQRLKEAENFTAAIMLNVRSLRERKGGIEHAKRIYRYLHAADRSLGSRVRFAVDVSGIRETKVYLLPEGSPAPACATTCDWLTEELEK